MIAQSVGYKLPKTIHNPLFRSLLPYIIQNQQWGRYLTQLSKVNNILLIINNKLVKKNATLQKCPICQKFTYMDNLFTLILHMEIQHECPDINAGNSMQMDQPESLLVKKYQFTYDGIEIHLLKKSSFLQQFKKQTSKKSEKVTNSQTSIRNYFVSTTSQTYDGFIGSTHKKRCTLLLQRIFSKFSKRLQTISTERKFYHSYNVFHIKSPESQSENSQEEQQNLVQVQLQRLRINDFNDVSQWDKLLFLEWNHLMRKEKKQEKIVYQNHQILSILQKFVGICRQKQIPRLNFSIHLYTLWSVGKIRDYDIIGLLASFDQQ